MRAWRHIEVVERMEKRQHRFWLFSIAKNLLTDHYRKRATREKIDAQFAREAIVNPASSPEPEKQFNLQEEMQQLDRAIGNVLENLRTVLLIQIIGEMDSTQIGEALDLPAGTVRYQIVTARKRLACEMQLEI